MTGFFVVTPEFLREALHLPINAEIIGTAWDAASMDMRIHVRHPDIIASDEPLRPTLRKQDPVVFVDWGQS